MSGEDSNRRSREFFCRGFSRIFQAEGQPVQVQDAVSNALYSALRCGFAHAGMPKNGINFSLDFPKPFVITWPMKDGVFLAEGKLQSAIVNPKLMIDRIEKHFDAYVRELRRATDVTLVSNFQKAVSLNWAIGEPERLVAMTENQFLRGEL